MPSFQTLFRATVMLVIGIVGFKAWTLYGPTNEQLKSTLTHLIELVQSSVQSRQQVSSVPDPRVAAPKLSEEQPIAAVAPSTNVVPLAAAEPPKLLPSENGTPSSGSPPAEASLPGGVALPGATSRSGQSTDRVSELMVRLEQLGAADPKLAPWGGDGQLYRFTCRAPLPSAPTMTQHFESVAAEPAVAVEQVLAKVEAWKVAQRDRGVLR